MVNQNDNNFNARHMIEALRSGIPSREVGYCFSFARARIMREIGNELKKVAEGGQSGGMFVSGKYGEGKTHLLNTVFNMAQEKNMAVSFVSLSKETPFDKPYMVYSKVVQNTYLPGRPLPGFGHIFDGMTQKSPLALELCEFCLKHLETDKLYYVLKSYLATEDVDEKFMLMADMEGDFMANATVKSIYRRIYSEKVNFSENFNKFRHAWDYFSFLNQLILKSGCSGWVLLFDEAELVGRLSKKARQSSYINMSRFIHPEKPANLKSAYSIFAFNASFIPDVIEGKQEYDNIEQNPISPEMDRRIKTVLNHISTAPQLVPLNRDEIMAVLEKIQELHGTAYNWEPGADMEELFSAAERRGYLLRTRIRAAVEILDQLYQYGSAGDIKVNKLEEASYSEEVSDAPPEEPDADF